MTYAPPLFKHLADSAVIVNRALELPCADPIAVFIEASAAVIGGLIWGVGTPDPKELYHMATGEPLVHSIRHALGDAHEANPRFLGKTRRFLGKFLGAADRFVWWQFLAASAEQGLIQAQSSIRRMAKCDNFHNPNFGSGGYYVSAISDDGTWGGIHIAITQPDSKFAPVTSSFVSAVPHRTALVAVSAQFEDFGGGPVPTGARIIREDTGIVLDSDNNTDDEGQAHGANHVWFKRKSGFGDLTFLTAQFQYTGNPLPLGEAFPTANTVNGYFYS